MAQDKPTKLQEFEQVLHREHFEVFKSTLIQLTGDHTLTSPQLQELAGLALTAYVDGYQTDFAHLATLV